MKASTTAWPPLVTTGLLMLLLTTSTDIPFSTRMPLVSFEFFTVILKSIVFSFCPQIPPRQAFVFNEREQEKRETRFYLAVCLQVSPNTFTERIEETISHARFHINWVFGTSLITKTKGEHRSSSPIINLANFLGRDSGMPSLPSRDCSPNSLQI